MWNRKKEDEPAARAGAPAAPASDAAGREAIPMSTYPATKRIDDATVRSAAVIGKSLVVVGKISGREDLVVDGKVNGDISLPENRLTVGAGGHVEGSVHAREIVVHGAIQGNLEASEKVEIKRNARVMGDLRASRPVIEDEAYFKGNVETVKADPPKPAPRPAAPPADPQPPLIQTGPDIKRA
jgi:cytoskeletal protein CcmA (bactofilin family)